MILSKWRTMWSAAIFASLCFILPEIEGQCTANFGCRDCAEWCPTFEHLCLTHNVVKDSCRRTCNLCSDNPKCVALNCAHRCVLGEDDDGSVVASCACFPGYTSDDGGRTCYDINECELPVNPCNKTGLTHCKNENGDFICTSCKSADVDRIWGYYNKKECCKRDRSTTCGKSTTNGRIIDGDDARVKRWPWTAYISIVDAICGGTLIDDNHVLTAAHCLDGVTSVKQIQVTLGLADTTQGGSGHIQEFDVVEMIIHPEYTFPNIDAAILRLSRPIAYGVFVTPVCLPGGHEPEPGELCYITGYGTTSYFGASASILQQANVPIVEGSLCEAAYLEEEHQVNSTIHICAGRDTGGMDTCQGDSGGPLVCQRCNSCDWYIAGITSFGRNCGAPGFYGVYTRLRYVERWISSVTGLPFAQSTCRKQVWQEWTSWGECSSTCGAAKRSRSRACRHGVIGDPGCTGQATDSQDCSLPSCSSWSEYTIGECTRSCGGGTRVNTRTCIGGNIGDDGCPQGGERLEEECNVFCCPHYGNYTDWSDCTVTCGSGQRVRTRECIVCQEGAEETCEGENLELQECVEQDCPFWGPYGQYGECTVTCGTGRQTATRRCIGGSPGEGECTGRSTRSRSCNTGDCDEWSAFGPCSATCGGGEQTRQRGAERETRFCMGQPCPAFGQYGPYSACSRECGGGQQHATRECMNGQVGQSGCVGPTRTTKNCNTHACNSFGPWIIGTCTKTCGRGRQTDTRQCLGGIVEGEGCIGPKSRTLDCNTEPCPRWSAYTSYDQCSVTCGGGIQSSTRQCLNGNVGEIGCVGDTVRVRDCSTDDCPVYSEWTPFSNCDATCDGGVRRRTRSCPQPNLCPPDAYGHVTEETEECNIQQCPGVWAEWENIDGCSVSCGVGSQSQERACVGGVPGGPGCEGSALRIIECSFPACWGEYSDFTDCSAPCGGGTQTRTRSCIGGEAGRGNCNGDAEDVRQCNKDPCGGVCGSAVNVASASQCCSFASFGYCSSYAVYMDDNCRLACCENRNGLPCTGQSNCFDNFGSFYCSTVLAHCGNPAIGSGCRRSCSLC